MRWKVWLTVCVRRDFPLELTWVLTPFPQNSFRWEYKSRSSLCTHAFHRWDWRIMTFMSWTGECWKQKHTQHAPSVKTECDYLSGGFKNGHIHKDLTQNGEPQRYSCGTQAGWISPVLVLKVGAHLSYPAKFPGWLAWAIYIYVAG